VSPCARAGWKRRTFTTPQIRFIKGHRPLPTITNPPGAQDSLPLSIHKYTMTDQFPTLLKQAAEDFTNECTAFAQFRIESGQFKARLQATEIMKQFVGDVTFGQGRSNHCVPMRRLYANFFQILRAFCFTRECPTSISPASVSRTPSTAGRGTYHLLRSILVTKECPPLLG